MTNCSVHFQPSDITVDVPAGTLLSDAAMRAGIPLRNDCGGQGLCKKCTCSIFNEDGTGIAACQYKIENDIDVFVPENSLRHDVRQLVIQEKNLAASILDNAVVNRQAKYGVALDIGTTTLAAELYQLHSTDGNADRPKRLGVVSRANSQRQFGADVITRIQRILENPAALETLHHCISEDVSSMLSELSEKSGIPIEHFEVISVAGNTVMEYLFLGIDPSPLGYAPFEAPIKKFPNIRWAAIASSPIQIETMPLFCGFVGGDIIAGTLALGLADKQETSFLIDIGTNGELALFSGGKIVVAATAAGPCFEGGGINCGTLALPGAISSVQISEDGEVKLTTIGNKKPNGICGSGLIEIVSELLRFNLINPTGKFNVQKDTPFSDRWANSGGKPAYVLSQDIVLTQSDVRQFQLAAGAIRSGITLLLKRQGLTLSDIDTFYIAGGFGSYIKAEAAQRVGLIPKMFPLEKVRFCGNTSLAGAALALFDGNYRFVGER
ncbi:MAG: ASKHA domain-containing protein, partial [Planctomycetaceae bacterium]|nr:ASKHA domain-containing protein [Planctomycetaceae bacterium]